MTSKLTKCIYGFETNPKKTPFGLLNNQVRIDNIIQNAGWFNNKGERLGQGDLTLKEMQHIAKHLMTNEVFFVLPEADTSWDIPSNLERTAPGFDYVMQKTAWAMLASPKGGVIVRVRDDVTKSEEVTRDGIKFVRVSREYLKDAFISFDKLVKKAKEAKEEAKDKVETPVVKHMSSTPIPATGVGSITPFKPYVTAPPAPTTTPGQPPATAKRKTIYKYGTGTTKTPVAGAPTPGAPITTKPLPVTIKPTPGTYKTLPAKKKIPDPLVPQKQDAGPGLPSP